MARIVVELKGRRYWVSEKREAWVFFLSKVDSREGMQPGHPRTNSHFVSEIGGRLKA